MSKLTKFLPLEKMEEQSDGTLHVRVIVTGESPDLDREICDYEGTKPYYAKRTKENLEKTTVPGMTPSLMPFREMHQPIVQGAGRDIFFDDEHKLIRMTFHVVDAEAVKKWKAGCFTGVSQGGEYVKRWPDPNDASLTRYIADPMEVSAVDAPCLPIAVVEAMKGRTVSLQKADGSIQQVSLEIPDAQMLVLEKMRRIVESFEKREFSATERQHAASTGAALPDGSFPIENEQDLRNAIHAIGRASDQEKAKAHIVARAKSLGLTQLLPEDWKASEKAATGGKEHDMAKLTDAAGFQKAAKTLHDHLENLKDAHEKLGKAHEEHHAKVGAAIDKCMKAVGAMKEGDEPEDAEKVAATGDGALEKKVDARFAEMTKAIADLTEKLSKTAQPAAAHTGAADTGREAAVDSEMFKGAVVTR